MSRCFGLSAILGLVGAAWVFAQAPDGYRTNTGEACGVGFYYPVEFAEFPLPPTETVTRARYDRKEIPEPLEEEGEGDGEAVLRRLRRPEARGRHHRGPEDDLIAESGTPRRGRRKPRNHAPNPARRRAEANRRPESDAAKSGPKTVREAMLEANRIVGFDEFRQAGGLQDGN
jgi:hypothetical protein